MDWDGGWVRTRSRDQLALLQMREGALDGAAGESGGGGEGLMGYADRPVRLLGGLTVKVKVDDERGQAPVMAHQVGQEAVEQVGVECYLYHR